MKRNSWKTLLSVVLLLAMLMSMLPFAAFAEDGQTAAAQTEDAAKADERIGDDPDGGAGDTPKDGEKADDAPEDEPESEPGDAAKGAPKDDDTKDANDDAARGEAKDAPKDDAAKDENKDTPKDDAAKDENKDTPKDDAAKDENKEGGIEQPAKGGAEDTDAQITTLEADDDTPSEEDSNPSATLIYNANGGTGTDFIYDKAGASGESEVFFKAERIESFTAPENKEFGSWNTSADGSGTTYNVGDLVIVRDGESLTLYAQWESQWEYYTSKEIDVLYYPGFDSSEGIWYDQANAGESYTVKGNTFKPPYNKHFVNWKQVDSETTYEAGQEITAPSETLRLLAQWADDPKWSELGIAISARGEAFPEAEINYTITVTNGTGYDLDSVTVDVTLPEEVTYNSQPSSGAWSLSYNSATRTVTAKLESADGADVLAMKDTSEFSLPVDIKKMAFKTIEAKAKIAGASSRTGGKTGEGSSAAVQMTMRATEINVITEQAEQTLDKEITYTVEITNQYGFALNSIEVNNVMSSNDCISGLQLSSDSLRNGWSLVSNSNGSLLCKFTGKLYSGATTSFKLTTSFDKVGSTPASKTAACTATITSLTDENGIIVSGNFGSKSRTVTLKELDWSKFKIEKKVDKTTAGLGDTLSYEIKVTNNTGYDLSYLCVEDPTPANTSYLGASQSSGNWFLSIPSDNSKVVAELRGGLANGASDTFTMEVGVDRDVPSGKVESTAKITSAKSGTYYDLTSDHPDGLPSNTVTTEIDPMFDLDIEVRALQPAAGVGEDHKFTYEVTVKNNGFWLSTAKIENIFPTGVGTIVGEPDQHCIFSSDYSTVEIYGGFPKGESVSYTITTNFVPGGAATAVLEAKIVSVTTQAENTYTGSKSANAAVYSLAGLTITKDVDKSEAKPGDVLTYTITVKNETGIAMKNVGVEDRLPIDKVDVDPKDLPNVVDYYPDTGLVYFDISDLAAGGEYSVEIKVTVKPGVIDTVVNTAAIVSATLDNGNEVDGKDLADKTDDATTDILTENVPVNVTVEFNGLEDISQVPADYKLTGDAGNAFLTGEVALRNAENKGGHISRSFSTTADVVLGKEYALNFTQTGYDVPGYTAALETTAVKATANDATEGLSFHITITYTKTLATYKALTVRTYFKGVSELPDNFGYTLTCTGAPEEATALLTQSPLTLTKGVENGVPYMEFSANNVTLQAGVPLTFSFTQSGYDIPGYVCALGTSTFKSTLDLPTTDDQQPILLAIENTYTQIEWSKLTITKTADKTYAAPGSYVKYTITVTNKTGVDLSNITVADKLAPALRYSDSTGDYSTSTGTWTVASLANGKSVSFTLTVKLKYRLTAGTVIENTARIISAAAGSQTYDLSGQKLFDSASVTVTGGKGSPQTGDESNLGLWIAVMAASLACAGAAAVIYKKRRG